ncbi:MAG: zinc-ribbon domain-containing protein [Nitrosarchaeum sp.]|nr:zinc-ribbon domain-containing protein [Nitrosarchaeum sp.]
MSAELRLKKLRGSGGYVMANVTDEQQMKGNLGGPDLFLAPIGRLENSKITKHFCNTCEKEFEGAPKIEFENPNEEVAENLILAEKGQYICSACNSTIAEYRQFKKQNEAGEIGNAKPLETAQTVKPQTTQQIPQPASPQTTTPSQPAPTQVTQTGSISSIEGLAVYDENAKKIGTAKQVGIDSNQSVVLLIIKNDGTEGSIPWNSIRKVGEIILLGSPNVPTQDQPGKCPSCGFSNKDGSKFCEECGTKIS